MTGCARITDCNKSVRIFSMNSFRNSKPHLAVIVGTRPNFVKAAPFLRTAKDHPRFDYTIIHTGQHFDQNMSEIFFEELGISQPDIFLDVGAGRHSEKLARMFDTMKEIFKHYKFDAVVVFGDVNSTLAGALAAIKNNTRLIHIEAGLRSHDKRMPEETNRVIVDHLAHLHFVTEPAGVENLKSEGVKDKKIHLVGNIMIESLELYRDKIRDSTILDRLGLRSKGYVLVTIHRQENTDSKRMMGDILTLIKGLSLTYQVVFPLHPGTQKLIKEYGLESELEGLTVIEPIGYFDFLKLTQDSRGVVTDSGGIQEETSHLGIPCCTLRDNTERPITLELGSNKLFPITEATVESMIEHLDRQDFVPGPIPLWDTGVSKRIFDVLESWKF